MGRWNNTTRSTNWVIILFFYALSISLFPKSALAEPEDKVFPQTAILLLASKESESCGTGFITDNGSIVTAAHVMRALCPGLRCTSLSARRALSIGQSADISVPLVDPIKIVFYPAFDIALLPHAVKDPTLKAGISSSSEAIQGAAVSAMGFAACRSLEMSKGTITDVDPLSFGSSLQAQKGMSGSPIINDKGAVVGVLTQNSSPIRSLTQFLFPISDAIRAAQYKLSEELNGLAPQDAFEVQLRGAADSYLTLLRERKSGSLTASDNILKTGRFLEIMKELIVYSSSLPPGCSTTPLLLANGFIEDLLTINPFCRQGAALGAIAGVILENRSLETRSFDSYPVFKLKEELSLAFPGTKDSTLLQIIDEFSAIPQKTESAILLGWGVKIGAVLFLVGAIWGSSLIYAVSQLQGRLWKRLLLGLLVASVIGPIVFIALKPKSPAI